MDKIIRFNRRITTQNIQLINNLIIITDSGNNILTLHNNKNVSIDNLGTDIIVHFHFDGENLVLDAITTEQCNPFLAVDKMRFNLF